MDGKQHFSPGLDGVVAAETNISYLDTQYSQILIRGYELIDLSKTKSYLELVHLLLEGGCRLTMIRKRSKGRSTALQTCRLTLSVCLSCCLNILIRWIVCEPGCQLLPATTAKLTIDRLLQTRSAPISF